MKIFLLIVLLLTLLVFLRLLLVTMRRKPDVAPPNSKSSVTDEWAENSYDTPSSLPRRANNSGRLAGKVALITGAGSGIGRACAIAFAREGARVALVGRRRTPLEEVAGEIGSAAFVCPGDVSKKDDIERIVRETVAHFGGLNVLVNNAG